MPRFTGGSPGWRPFGCTLLFPRWSSVAHITDNDIFARWKEEPAPLLPILHDFHDRDGYLSAEAIGAVAQGLRIPIADLFGTVTFYHHFAREPGDSARRGSARDRSAG